MCERRIQYTLKYDVDPGDITSANHLLENYSSKPGPKKDKNNHQHIEDLQFIQRGEVGGIKVV